MQFAQEKTGKEESRTKNRWIKHKITWEMLTWQI